MTMFEKGFVEMNLQGNDQTEIFASLAKLAKSQDRVKSADQLVEDYEARKKESTTGFGNGIAIPHAKSNNVRTATILVGRCEKNIEWNSLDEKPVNNIISLLVPMNEGNVHLQLLAKLSRQLVHKDFIRVLKTGSVDEVFELINNTISQ